MKNIGNGTAKDIAYTYQWDNGAQSYDRGAFPVQALSSGESQTIKVNFSHTTEERAERSACFLLRYRDLLENAYTQKLNMTFNQINYFLAVAEHLNFTQAAASLYITQSTLSRNIATLEDEIGTPLLERDFHSVRLTPAGDLMYREIKCLMDAINTLINQVRVVGNAAEERFTIGILEGHSVAPGIMYAIRCLSEKYPNLSVDIRRLSHQELVDSVKANKLDVAQTVVGSNEEVDPVVDSVTLKMLSCYLMARSDDPIWEGEDPPSLLSLDRMTLIAPEHYYPGLDVVNRKILAVDIKPRIKKGPDMETQSLWLESGLGVYIANESSVIYTSRSFRPVRAQLLPELPPLAEVLIWNKNYHADILEVFLSFLQRNPPDKHPVN